MGHRDGLLVTLNLSEAKNHGCRPHLRGSVRRASGFVLTGNPEVMPKMDSQRCWPEVLVLYLKSLSAVSEAPPERKSWESRGCGEGRFRYSDLKEAAPRDYGICIWMSRS